MSLNDNSVSVAGKVVGNIKAVSYTNNDSSTIDVEKNKLFFLNNDVSLLAGADVSSGDLVGGAGKNSVITPQALPTLLTKLAATTSHPTLSTSTAL